jgi:hypothetical protein
MNLKSIIFTPWSLMVLKTPAVGDPDAFAIAVPLPLKCE